jgi:cbb3-type cytochrome oxidase subunit 3
MIMGILTAVLIVLYCGIIGWAYSARRRDEFALMASLPLAETETRP